jgi:hypothetical protein
MQLVVPFVHQNGTSKRELLDQRKLFTSFCARPKKLCGTWPRTSATTTSPKMQFGTLPSSNTNAVARPCLS